MAAYMERVGAKKQAGPGRPMKSATVADSPSLATVAKKQQGKRTDKANGGTSATLAEVAAKLGVPRKTAKDGTSAGSAEVPSQSVADSSPETFRETNTANRRSESVELARPAR